MCYSPYEKGLSAGPPMPETSRILDEIRRDRDADSPRKKGRIASVDANFYAELYLQLLGSGWKYDPDESSLDDGRVAFGVLSNEIYWIDLAPEGEGGLERTLRIPGGTSIGATVGILKGLADVLRQY